MTLLSILSVSFPAYSQQAVSLEQQIGQGEAAFQQGDNAKALSLWVPLLDQLRATGNKEGLAQLVSEVGEANNNLGNFDEALAAFQQARAIDRDIGNRLGEANALISIGNVETKLGRYGDALSSEQQALAIERDTKDRRAEATALSDIGIVETNLGHYDDALSSQQQALAIQRELNNRLGEANALSGVGDDELYLGRYDDALSSQQQALAIDRELKYRLGEANGLTYIGTVELYLGRYDDALGYYQQALAIERELKNRLGEANALGNIGYVEAALERNDDALSSDQQSLVIARELKVPFVEAHALNNIANVERKLGRYDDSLKYAQAALGINRELKNLRGEATALIYIAAAELYLGHLADALESAHQAETVDREPVVLWHSLRTAAAVESHLEDRGAALADYEGALSQIEAQRAGLNQGERSTFFSDKLSVYDAYIAYLFDLDRRFPGKGYDRKALEVFERKSAWAVLEQVGESAAQHFRGVPADVVGAEGEAGIAADRAQSTLSDLLSTAGADRTAIASAEQNLAGTKARIATLEASIKQQYPAYYELRHPQPLAAQCQQPPCLTIAGFQQSVLRPDELVLVYDILPKQSAVWLIDRDRVQLVPLAGGKDIETAIGRLGTHVAGMLDVLSKGNASGLERKAAADIPAFAANSYALYKLVVPEAAATAIARAKSLIVVPSGPLYSVAFETLVNQDPSAAPQPHYLIEDLPISYIPSASLLAVVRTSYAQSSAGRSPLLAFANPTFGTAAGSDRGPATFEDLQLAAVRSAVRGYAGSMAIGETIFPALPGTQTEADDVRSALDAPAASLFTGDAATRARVLELNASDSLKRYRYVLFATHAVLPNEIAGLTQPAIVLAHPERGNGLLTMADVFGLSLDADFVTLSACSTGVATGEAGGGGVSGLTRAFLYAGTPAISVTLWELDDAAAPQITPPFFAGMHAGKLTAAEALRQAKLAMLRSPQARFRHPYAWGPSVIFGDGNRDN